MNPIALDKQLDCVRPAHFLALRDEKDRRELLARSLELIEIEVFSHCNRRCGFCPNAIIDRSGENRFMPEEEYLSILRQLRAIDYHNMISFSRYNEPLSDPVIVKRVRQARELLPDAYLLIYTNGDFITPQLISDLEYAGLNDLRIMVYMPENVERTKESVERAVAGSEDRTGLNLEWEFGPNSDGALKRGVLYGMEINISVFNLEFNGVNRGALVDVDSGYKRRSPCAVPFSHMYIDYNGSIMPCCNLRSDAPEHVPYIMGNAFSERLEDVFSSPRLISWREALCEFNGDRLPPPCTGCSRQAFRETPAAVRRLSETLLTPGGMHVELGDLKREMTGLQEREKSASVELESLKGELAGCREREKQAEAVRESMNGDSQKRHAALTADYESLLNRHASLENSYEVVAGECARLIMEKTALAVEAETLAGQCGELREKTDCLAAERERLTDALRHEQAETALLRKSRDKAHETIERLRKETALLKETLERETAAGEAARNEAECANRQKAALEEKLGLQEKEMAHLSALCDESRIRHDKLNAKASDLWGLVLKLDSSMNEVTKQNRQLKERLSENEGRLNDSERYVSDLLQSNSWRVTAPLRKVTSLLRKLRP